MNITKIPHPYYPLEVEIADYIVNDYTVFQLLSTFAVGCLIIMACTAIAARGVRPDIRSADLWACLWWVICGSIHLFFEGYYSYNFMNMAGQQTLFAQMWKEYALSDSRYLTQDAFVMVMESVTAFAWGPLSYFIATTIVKDHPLRHPLQIIVSLGQLYGNVLYYGTNTFSNVIHGLHHSRLEAKYFYGYYIFLNAFWIFIPVALIWQSVEASRKAFAAVDRASRSLDSMKLNANAKKIK